MLFGGCLRLIKNLYNATEAVYHVNSQQYKYVFFKGFTLIRRWVCSNQLMASRGRGGLIAARLCYNQPAIAGNSRDVWFQRRRIEDFTRRGF